MTEWSLHWIHNPAVLWFESRSDHLVDLLATLPSSNSVKNGIQMGNGLDLRAKPHYIKLC